ncbi:MAG: prolyl oligopeptidase family serine peptidase [Bacteroidales bacterium]
MTIKTLVSSEQKESPTLSVKVIAPKASSMEVSTNNIHKLSINHILEGTRPTSATISPNGQFALIKYTTVYQEKGNTSSYTKLIDLKSKKTLLTDYNGRNNVSWMPRTNKLFYTRNASNGNRELVTVEPTTGEEFIIDDNLPEGYFSWSPSEEYLVFSKSEQGKAESGDLRQYLNPADRQPNYRNRIFLHKYDLNSRILSPVTFGLKTSSLQSFSSDGRYILLSRSDETLTDWPLSVSSFYKVDMNTLEVDTILSGVPHVSSAQFSPDSKTILFTGTGEAFNGIGKTIPSDSLTNIYNTEAFLMNLETKVVTHITRQFDPSIQRASWSQTNPSIIYFTTADRDYVTVYRYNSKNNSFAKLPLDVEVVSTFDIALLANTALYFGQSASSPSKIYSCDLNKEKSTLIDFPQQASFNEYQLGEVKEYNIQSKDGNTIYGRYYLPPNFDPSKKYPMIVYYYGGTTPVERLFESRYPLHLYAAMGYVVYNPQPSGAIGFGQSFAARHVNAWGIHTAEDIIEGTKQFCTDHTFVNTKKIGCIGASYGGFMTQYLLTRTDLFAAAVSHAGISDITSYWGEGYWGYAYSAAATAKSFPWNAPELYTKQSPLSSADKISSPLLLLHGGEDTNVPIGESIQMFTALKMLGKEVAFVEVKGENHAIANYQRRIKWNNTIFAWFAKWLQDKNEWWDELYPKVNL